jgi:hypothetical protein
MMAWLTTQKYAWRNFSSSGTAAGAPSGSAVAAGPA